MFNGREGIPRGPATKSQSAQPSEILSLQGNLHRPEVGSSR